MSVGSSGRIVIEIDPALKRQIYAMLALQGLTLKEWFIRQVEGLRADGNRLPLDFAEVSNKAKPGA